MQIEKWFTQMTQTFKKESRQLILCAL